MPKIKKQIAEEGKCYEGREADTDNITGAVIPQNFQNRSFLAEAEEPESKKTKSAKIDEEYMFRMPAENTERDADGKQGKISGFGFTYQFLKGQQDQGKHDVDIGCPVLQ